MRKEPPIAMASVYRRSGDMLEFLIIHRVPDDGGFWQPVTGGIDEGELPRETVIREIAEEIGIEELLHVSDELERRAWQTDGESEGMDIVHAVEVAQHAEVVLSDEHDDFRWLPLEEAIVFLKFEGNKQSLRTVHQYARGRMRDD
jgi:dATP pyrophosphohydrolase